MSIVGNFGGPVGAAILDGSTIHFIQGTSAHVASVEAGGITERGMVMLPDRMKPTAVFLRGSTLLCFAGKGLAAVNVSDPAHPVIASVVDLPGMTSVTAVDMQGSIAYIGDNGTTLRAYDVAQPDAPVALGQVAVSVNRIACSPGRVYCLGAATNPMTCAVVDASAPATLLVRSTLPLPLTGTGYPRIAASGGTVYIGSWDFTNGIGGLHVVDATDADHPAVVSTTAGQYGVVAVSGNRLYIQSWHSGTRFTTYSIDIPMSPLALGSVVTTSATGVSVSSSGALLYASSMMSHVDLTNEATPSARWVHPVPAFITGQAIRGHHLHLAENGGLYTYDITTPLIPLFVSHLPMRYVSAIAADGNLVYAVHGDTIRFTVLDYSQPTAPTELSRAIFPDNAVGMRRIGTTLYVIGWFSTLTVIDVRDPTAPVISAPIGLPGHPRDIQIAGDGRSLVIAGHDSSANSYYALFDCSDPLHPTLQSTMMESEGALAGAAVIAGTRMYTMAYVPTVPPTCRLSLYDVTNPATPVRLDRKQGNGSAWRMLATDSVIYASIPGGSLHLMIRDMLGIVMATSYLTILPVFLEAILTDLTEILYAPSGTVYPQYGKGSTDDGVYIVTRPRRASATQSLTMAISPPQAATDGCSTQPGVGTTSHPVVTDVSIRAIPRADKGWSFSHWEGAAGGSVNPTTVHVDRPLQVTAVFVQVASLTLTSTPRRDDRCVEKVRGSEYAIMECTLTANSVADWDITAMGFETSGDPRPIRKAILQVGATRIEEEYDTTLGVSFSFTHLLPKGGSVPITLIYRIDPAWECPMEHLLEHSAQTKIEYVNAQPHEIQFRPGVRLPPGVAFPSGLKTLFCALNETRQIPYASLHAALNDAYTGDVVGICPGRHRETSMTIPVGRLTVEALEGSRDGTIIINESHIFSIFGTEKAGTTFQGFTMDGLLPDTAEHGGNRGIQHKDTRNLRVVDCAFRNFATAIQLENSRNDSISASSFLFNINAIDALSCRAPTVVGCVFRNNTRSVDFSVGTRRGRAINNQIYTNLGAVPDNRISYYGLQSSGDSAEFIGNTIDLNAGVMNDDFDGSGILCYGEGHLLQRNTIHHCLSAVDFNHVLNTRIIGNNILFNTFGLELGNQTSDVVVAGNRIGRNRTGLDIEYAGAITILTNDFFENGRDIVRKRVQAPSGTLMPSDDIRGGVVIRNASTVTMECNRMLRDSVSAVTLSDGAQGRFRTNAIIEPTGFAMRTATSDAAADARGNYWGAPTGPGGAGPGAGAPVSSGVDFGGWLAAPPQVVVSAGVDTMYLTDPVRDSLLFAFTNWSLPADSLAFSCVGGGGLVLPVSDAQRSADSLPCLRHVIYDVPTPPAGMGRIDRFLARVTSFAMPTAMAADTVVLIAYTPTLTEFRLTPDSAVIHQDDSVRFRLVVRDQYGRPFPGDVTWQCDGGTVDSLGLFVADSTIGRFLVRASHRATGREATAIVVVQSTTGIGHPSDHRLPLWEVYPNPASDHIVVSIESAPAGILRIELLNLLGQTLGSMEVDVPRGGSRDVQIDAASLPRGLHVVRITCGSMVVTRKLLLR